MRSSVYDIFHFLTPAHGSPYPFYPFIHPFTLSHRARIPHPPYPPGIDDFVPVIPSPLDEPLWRHAPSPTLPTPRVPSFLLPLDPLLLPFCFLFPSLRALSGGLSGGSWGSPSGGIVWSIYCIFLLSRTSTDLLTHSLTYFHIHSSTSKFSTFFILIFTTHAMCVCCLLPTMDGCAAAAAVTVRKLRWNKIGYLGTRPGHSYN